MSRYASSIFVLIIIFGMLIGVIFWVSQRQGDGPTLPLLGRINIGGSQENVRVNNALTLESIYGYRPSPQYYHALLDTVEIRALIVNNTNEVATGQFEAKIYKIAEIWDTKTHQISYEERLDYIVAQSKDEIMSFSEDQIADIRYSQDRCDGNIPCYHDNNPDDGDNPYGGVVLEDKPIFVNIGDELYLEKNERVVYTATWNPEQCGYFMVMIQEFGHQGRQGEDPDVKVGFVQIRGCEEGRILENGMVSGVATTGASLDADALPGTASGFVGFVIPGIGLMIGGLLMHVGSRGYKIR